MKMQTFHRHVVFLVHFAQETHSAKYYKVLTTSRCSQNFVIFCTVSFLSKMYKKNNMPVKCLHFHFLDQSTIIHGVRMKSSTQQKVSQLVQDCKYLSEIVTSTTGTIIYTRSQSRLKIFETLSN